jgi:hypothetical protein
MLKKPVSRASKSANQTSRVARLIGGAHQQTSERAAPPVSVAEKGKATREKRKKAIIFAYEHTILKLTVFMLLGGPQNTIKSHLVFTALFCFAPFSVFLQSYERALLTIVLLS